MTIPAPADTLPIMSGGDQQEWVDAEEAARILGVSVKVVRRLAVEGRLPGTKIGRQWRFRPERLRDLPAGELRPRSDNTP